MTIPTAVSPSTLTPGLYMTVDLLAGTASPGTGTLYTAIVATKSAAGDLTDNTEVRSLGSDADAVTAFGSGAHGHLMTQIIWDQYPAAQIDVISPTAGATVATLDVTAAGSPASDQVVDVDINGRTGEVSWLTGETADEIKVKLINWVLENTAVLPVTAVTGGVGITTINSKITGLIGNDNKVKMKLRLAQTGTETLTGAVVHTALAGGTTDPDITTALSNLEGKEYHYIGVALSNADIAQVATTNNAKRLYSHIAKLNSGKDCKLQQGIVGYTGTYATAQTSTSDVDSFNNAEFMQLANCFNGLSLPCEWAAWELGNRLAAVTSDPAANRIGNEVEGLFGAYDKIADNPTPAESEACIGNGVSIYNYNPQGKIFTMRPITTHSKDAAGGDDRRLLDTQNVDAAYIVARDLRTNLPIEFANAKIQPDSLPTDDPPPAGVVEERDVKAYVIERLRFRQDEGVVSKASLDTAISTGTLIVKVNATDATQVDLVVPFEIIQPLAKMGVVAQRVPS